MKSSVRSRRRFLTLAAASPLMLGSNWPQFRGPAGLGVSNDKQLPTKWSDGQNIAWQVDLPGHGTSSPITYGDRIYITYYTGYGLDAEAPGDMEKLDRHLACLNRADGKTIWTASIKPELPESRYESFLALHGYASSTPVSDGERIYTFFGRTGVFAFDQQGKQVWRADVGEGTHGWGSATSPVLHKNLVIINASVESGSLVALDKSTGRQVWSVDGIKRAWNTPLLVELPDGRTELVVSMQGELFAVDPATGERLWTSHGIDDYICPSVIAHEGVIYAIGARKNTAIAVKAGGKGDVTESHLLWTAGEGSNVSSPVYHEGHVYWANEKSGIAYCLNARDGELVYKERMDPSPGRIYASPVLADGKIYYVSRDQGTFVVAAKPMFELLAHNVIASDTSIFNASPAISDGQLLLRSDKALYCIG